MTMQSRSFLITVTASVVAAVVISWLKRRDLIS